ncbi:MAG: peptide chain release factor N(5)-glutamine methyltransferase [Candidatus Neomarinimicrobiota bacterium]|nr:peptide chain release factor N(5)-glutamine methyltransferase [Candidatus Neomarinimicrobiota bacterium]
MNDFQLLNEYFSSKLFQLEKIEIDEHKKKSELLIEDILGINKSDIYTKNYYIPHEKIELLEHAFSQLKENTPVQHILGKSYFYNDEFFTPPGTFIPRPETELIVDCIRNDFSRLEKKNVLEIGSGTGCLSISIAKLYKNFSITGIDISEKAIETSITNAKKLNCSNTKFIKQDFFKMNFNRYDIVISNPPYLALEEVGFLDESVKNHDPLMALSDNKDGLSFYKFFVNNIDLFLEKDGSMYFEIPNSSITEIIIELVKNNQKINSKIFKDFEGNNRVIKIY